MCVSPVASLVPPTNPRVPAQSVGVVPRAAPNGLVQLVVTALLSLRIWWCGVPWWSAATLRSLSALLPVRIAIVSPRKV